MGNLTSKEIKTLVKAAKGNLGDVIAEEATTKIASGEPIEMDLRIEIGVDDPPTAKYTESRQCFYFCYTIGGTRYCFRYCY